MKLEATRSNTHNDETHITHVGEKTNKLQYGSPDDHYYRCFIYVRPDLQQQLHR